MSGMNLLVKTLDGETANMPVGEAILSKLWDVNGQSNPHEIPGEGLRKVFPVWRQKAWMQLVLSLLANKCERQAADMLKTHNAHFAFIALDVNCGKKMEGGPLPGTKGIQTVFGGKLVSAKFGRLEQ